MNALTYWTSWCFTTVSFESKFDEPSDVLKWVEEMQQKYECVTLFFYIFFTIYLHFILNPMNWVLVIILARGEGNSTLRDDFFGGRRL